MILTPLDVQQKTFGTAIRGYDLDEVDQFLDNIVKSLKHYEDQLQASVARQSQLETELSRHTETDEQISRALLSAQRSADQVIEDANREAERIVEEARRRADEVAAKRELEKSRLQIEVDNIRRGIAELRTRIGSLVSSMEADLDSMERATDQTEAQFASDFPPSPAPIPKALVGMAAPEALMHEVPAEDVSSGPVVYDQEIEFDPEGDSGNELDDEIDDGWVRPALDDAVDDGLDDDDPSAHDPGDSSPDSDLPDVVDELVASTAELDADGGEWTSTDLPYGTSDPDEQPSEPSVLDEGDGPEQGSPEEGGQEEHEPDQGDAIDDLPVRHPGSWEDVVEDRASEWRRPDLEDIEPYRPGD